MNNRKFLIYMHLGIASLFMPLLLLMPFTGAMYLWGFQGDTEKSLAFEISEGMPLEPKAQEAFFREQFLKNKIDYNFEYIKNSKTELTFRPTSRLHYMAKIDEGKIVVSKVEPNLLKRMIEIHKGHGPKIMRIFESIFGISLILTTLSGIWLAWSVKLYRKILLISFGVGTAILAVCMI